LSAAALTLIAEPTNEILVSPASYWEVAIKVSPGKYPLTVPFEQFWTAGIDGSASAFFRSDCLMPPFCRHCQCTTKTLSTG
jgi:hypothetical protein